MKKILIIDLCYEENSLHYNEFVKPVVDIVKTLTLNYEIIHYKKLDFSNLSYLNNFNKIILCGVALKDFGYLEEGNFKVFEKLKHFNGCVLGVCAGAQIIGKLFNCEIKEGQEIGLYNLEIISEDILLNGVNLDEIYCLHNNYLEISKDFTKIAKTKNYIQIFKKITNSTIFYGVLFHPEVRNKNLILNFCNL